MQTATARPAGRPERGGAPLFEARLTPHRSLTKRGFLILMVCVTTFCFTVGLVFMTLGLWPVLGFMGLDGRVLWWAIRASMRSGRAFEDVRVTRQSVDLRQVTPAGAETRHSFPQYGTRFEVDRHEEIGITAMRLANRARSVAFGAFLNPRDRETFASAFAGAMAKAKR